MVRIPSSSPSAFTDKVDALRSLAPALLAAMALTGCAAHGVIGGAEFAGDDDDSASGIEGTGDDDTTETGDDDTTETGDDDTTETGDDDTTETGDDDSSEDMEGGQPESECNDGQDNDADTYFDCEDQDCWDAEVCQPDPDAWLEDAEATPNTAFENPYNPGEFAVLIQGGPFALGSPCGGVTSTGEVIDLQSVWATFQLTPSAAVEEGNPSVYAGGAAGTLNQAYLTPMQNPFTGDASPGWAHDYATIFATWECLIAPN